MILDKSRKGRLAVGFAAAISLSALGAAGAIRMDRAVRVAQTSANSEQHKAKPDERLRELMTERYEILKSIVALLEEFVALDTVSLPQWRDAKVAMYLAQADLTTDRAEHIKVYEEMVNFLHAAEKQAKQRTADGLMTEAEFKRARLATIEGQIALERLR